MKNNTPTPEQRVEDTAAMFQHVANFGGGPASPMQVQYGMTDGVPNIWFAVGMTKREEFASRFMAALLSNGQVPDNKEDLCTVSTALADALLERLKK
jgi:hypothetical protein